MTGAVRIIPSQPLGFLAPKTASGGKIRAHRVASEKVPRNRLYRLGKIPACKYDPTGPHILGNTIGNAVAGGIAQGSDTATQTAPPQPGATPSATPLTPEQLNGSPAVVSYTAAGSDVTLTANSNGTPATPVDGSGEIVVTADRFERNLLWTMNDYQASAYFNRYGNVWSVGGAAWALGLLQPGAPETIVANNFVPRSQWGAQDPILNNLTRYNGQYDTITLHHSGSEVTPQDVQALHMGAGNYWRTPLSALGFPVQDYKDGDVGYNFMIGKDGKIYEGRSLDYVGAHVAGHNAGNIGIVMLGDYSKSGLSDAQSTSLNALVASLENQYPIQSVKTHGQFDPIKSSELSGAMPQIKNLLTK